MELDIVSLINLKKKTTQAQPGSFSTISIKMLQQFNGETKQKLMTYLREDAKKSDNFKR